MRNLRNATTITEMMKEGSRIVSECTCGGEAADTTCYSCLCNYYNQKQHDILQRRYAIEFFDSMKNGMTSWSTSVLAEDNGHHESGLMAVFNDDGQDQSGMTYDDIWDYLMMDTEQDEEIAILSDLKTISSEDKEKPYYNGSIKIIESGQSIPVDLIWKKSKIALFLGDNFEDYETAKTTDWKVFCLCDEFNAKKNTVWKYKSLLKACDELIEAESQGIILIEQAASICSFDMDSQKIIVKAIINATKDGRKLLGKDVDKLIKQIKNDGNFNRNFDEPILQAKVSSIIAALFSSDDKKEMDSSIQEKKDISLFDRYALKFSTISKNILNNKLDDLKPNEIKSLISENDNLKILLENAYLFSELMSGRYKGKEVFSDTKIDEADLDRFNSNQLKKLILAYEKATNLGNIVNQISMHLQN